MINYGSGSDSERSTSVPEICFLVCLQAMTHPALQIFGALSFMYKSSVTHTMVLFMRHSATHNGSSNRRRSFHMHFPPQEFRNTRKDFLSPLVQKITCSQSTVATLRPLRMTSLLPEQPTVMPWHYPELWRNCNHGHCGIWSALLCQKRLSAVLLTIPEDPPYRWWPCYPFSQLNHEAKVRRECDSS